MYQLFTPPWISTSRIGCRVEVVVAVAEDLVQPQHRPRAVPILPQGHLRPFDALPAQFPVGVQPVGIADHDDQAVLGLPLVVGDAPERQVLGLGQLGLDLLQTSWGSASGCRRLLTPLAVGPAHLGSVYCRSKALTNSSFFMECQPGTFFFLAIEAKSRTVRLLSICCGHYDAPPAPAAFQGRQSFVPTVGRHPAID